MSTVYVMSLWLMKGPLAVGLPVLSITMLPPNQTLPDEPNVQGAASLLTFGQMSSPTMYNLYNSDTCSMDKILFPGMNSYTEITAVPRRMTSNLSTRKPWQVATLDLRSQDLKTKDTTMVWVPNSQQKSQEQENREKPLKVHIKELTFADACGELRRKNRDSDVPKIRKVTKPPTGGRPHNLILANSPIMMQAHTRKWMTARSTSSNLTTEVLDVSECLVNAK
ncbi:PREDICTED: uncharacterized protein LOC108789355 [Nanorana parkeri]|uniref:uncharacterized protein LOC108789355 n=1 Tax=Nanorana parkeri TaxID=125878 RepID=UPI000854198D|nr:PREDICTED: uncharacterized protein LOC108789355 [Nanorana parkeri]